MAFTRRLIALRRDHPVFRRRRWFQGRPIRGTVDLGWCRPDGEEMGDEDWDNRLRPLVRPLPERRGHPEPGRPGAARSTDDSFVLLFNAHHEPLEWQLPPALPGPWKVALDTAVEPGKEGDDLPIEGDRLEVQDRSMVVLTRARSKPRPRPVLASALADTC